MSFSNFFGRRNPGAPLIVPLKAFYARDRKQEAARARFYGLMAKEHGFENWILEPKVAKLKSKKPGREGRRSDIQEGTTRNPTVRDLRACASEFLQTGTYLNDPAYLDASDRDKTLALQYGDIRRRAARQYVELVEAVSDSMLSSPDWMKEGHVTAGPSVPGLRRLDAAADLRAIRNGIPNESLALANRVLLQDEFAWERIDGRGIDVMPLDDRKVVLEDLRLALDWVAMALGWISSERMNRRWAPARDLTILRPAISRARRGA